MKIGILGVGKVDAEFIERVREPLGSDFANSETELIAEELQLPERAFNEVRGQYDIDVISQRIEDYAEKQARFGRILGIADVGIFVPRLNFVLGVAEHLGKTALVSLWRLKPEFARVLHHAFCERHPRDRHEEEFVLQPVLDQS